MSHTVEVKVKFKLDQAGALEKAFRNLNWSWLENSTMKEYSGQGNKKFRFVAKNPSKEYNAYDVGFELDKDGNLTPFTDLYGGNVEGQLGKDFVKLKGEYTYNVIEDHFTTIGAMVRREWNGTKQVVTVEQY